MSKGMVEPQQVLANLQQGAQLEKLSSKLNGMALPGGTPDAKIRLGYVSAFDPQTWTVTAMIGDQVTPIPNIQVLGHVQPMIGQAAMFAQTGGDKTSQYTMIGVLTQGNTGGTVARIRKTTAQTVTNSTTLGADSELKFYAQSNRSYIYHAQLYVRQNSTNATLDFNFGWILPSGATWSGGGAGPDTGIAAGAGTQVVSSSNYRGLTDAPAGSVLAYGVEPAASGGVFDSRIVSVYVTGTLKMGNAGGLCSVAWCQNIGLAASTEVRSGSYLSVDATSELIP